MTDWKPDRKGDSQNPGAVLSDGGMALGRGLGSVLEALS